MSVSRLLMVDDEPAIGTMVRRVAEDLGYDMRFVTHADAFKKEHGAFDPDVVILDLAMPDTDGIELLGFLAKERSRAQVLILSGFDDGVRDGAHLLGQDRGLKMVGIVSKPVRVTELRDILTKLKAG